MGTKPNLNFKTNSNFISNYLFCSHFSFSCSRDSFLAEPDNSVMTSAYARTFVRTLREVMGVGLEWLAIFRRQIKLDSPHFLAPNFSKIQRKIYYTQSNRYASWCTALTTSTDARTNAPITGTKLNKNFFSVICRLVGTLKSDDGDGNENVKKATGQFLRFSFVIALLGDIRTPFYLNITFPSLGCPWLSKTSTRLCKN